MNLIHGIESMGRGVRLRILWLWDIALFAFKSIRALASRSSFNLFFVKAANDQVFAFAIRTLPVYALSSFLMGAVLAIAVFKPMHQFGMLSAYGSEIIPFLFFDLVPLSVSLIYAFFSFPSLGRWIDRLEESKELSSLRAHGIGIHLYPTIPTIWACFISLAILWPICGALLFAGLSLVWCLGSDLNLSILTDAWISGISIRTILCYLLKWVLFAISLGTLSVAIKHALFQSKKAEPMLNVSVFYGSLIVCFLTLCIELLCLLLTQF